jgi:hypothetical protein
MFFGLKKFCALGLFFCVFSGGVFLAAQEEENLPYLSDEDIAALEINYPGGAGAAPGGEPEPAEISGDPGSAEVHAEAPAEVPPPAPVRTVAAERETKAEAPREPEKNEISRLNSSLPLYHLLILDRAGSRYNADIGGTEKLSVAYKLKHGRNGYLIAIYKSSPEGPVFPVLPPGSRVLVDLVSTRRGSLRDYVDSAAFRRFVSSRWITAQIREVLSTNF